MIKKTIDLIKSMKNKDKITMLTAYDYPSAKLLEECGIDIILVGDSLGNVMLGHDSTRPVTMTDMVHHTKAVARAVNNSLLVSDMPYKSDSFPDSAVVHAKMLIEAGAKAVKIERDRPEIVKALVENNIEVMGHIGLTPQTATEYKVQGKDEESANRLLKEAKSLEQAGCFSIVLECVPATLAKQITESINIPTIGIGAGVHCDGQVLVYHDMLGLTNIKTAKFVKKFANLYPEMEKAINEYKKEVKESKYPNEDYSYK